MSSLIFDRAFEPRHGEPVEMAPGVRRITARNPGIYTFHGTNTYLVGERDLGVIDPGPDDPAHIKAILDAAGDAPIVSILLTHGHADHSSGAAAIRAATNALIFSGSPRAMADRGFDNPESTASRVAPDRPLSNAMRIEGTDWSLEAVATPGHASDHHAFALDGSDALFSGDHVMGWSTSIVAPPDGSMRDYMASLDLLVRRPERRYLPGHGGPIHDGPGFVEALAEHRRARERAIVARLAAGDRRITQIVANIYSDTDPRLHAAAALSVLAHLEALGAEGRVVSDGTAGLDSEYALA